MSTNSKTPAATGVSIKKASSKKASSGHNPKDTEHFAKKQAQCKDLLPSIEKVSKASNETILDCILTQIKPVDFEKIIYPQLEELRDRLKQEEAFQTHSQLQKRIKSLQATKGQKMVVVCEQVLETAKKLNYGLAKKGASIYVYNGQYWSPIDPDVLQHYLGACAERMEEEPYQWRQYKIQAELSCQFVATAYLKKIPTNDRISINLLNGTFDISSNGQRRLRVFRPGDFLTYQLSFEYDTKADCPIFKNFINEVLPDINAQCVLAEFIGYIFTKNLKLEKALILYGSGANGKSVIFDIISALLGRENVSSYSMTELCVDNGYYRAKVEGKLLNYASEIGGKTNSDTFKKLASGEPISARLPYGDPFIIENYARLIFNANTLPKDTEMTNAFFRRFMIIPFNVTIPEDRQDKELASKIITNELPGIFNWVLEGVDRLMVQKRFTYCDLIERELEQFRKESDTVQLFLEDENYHQSVESTKSLMDLYNEYRIFCSLNGYRSLSKKNMAKRLRSLGFQERRLHSGKYLFIEKKAFEL